MCVCVPRACLVAAEIKRAIGFPRAGISNSREPMWVVSSAPQLCVCESVSRQVSVPALQESARHLEAAFVESLPPDCQGPSSLTGLPYRYGEDPASSQRSCLASSAL